MSQKRHCELLTDAARQSRAADGAASASTAKHRVSYVDFRSEAKDGDILLFAGRSLFSRLIRRLTGSAYSHVGIVAWWGPRLMVLEAVGHGVRAVPTSVAVDCYPGKVEWFAPQDSVALDRRQVVELAKGFVGLAYSASGIGRFLMRLLFGSYARRRDRQRMPGKVFCSQYVSRCYRLGGFDLVPRAPDEFTSPGQIAQCPHLVRRGLLRQR